MSEQREVRQCAKCHQAAVILVNEWQHTGTFGSTGEVTQDFRCQRCGAWFIRRSKMRAISLWVAGVLLLPACGIGLPFLWLAWMNGRFDERLKVMPDAPVPATQFPGGPPQRIHAACMGVATAVKITRHTNRGIPTGTEYTYRCAQCAEEFTTETWWGSVTSMWSAVICAFVAFAFFTQGDSPAWKYGGSGVMVIITALVSWSGVSSIINRFKHKEVTAPVVVNELR